MRPVVKLLGLVLAVVPAAVSSQTAVDDVRCYLLTSAVAAGTTDHPTQLIAAANVAFYLGRIDAREPDTIKAALKQLDQETQPGTDSAFGACARRAADAQIRLQTFKHEALPAK